MSVSDIVRTIARNVRQTVSDPGELKQKAKDLPVNALQTALTGVGQALMLGDRVRSGIKRLLGDDDKPGSDERTSGGSAAATVDKEPAKQPEPARQPARREPVIFSPRPSTSEDSLNGSAPKAEPTAAAPPAVPAPPMKPAPASVTEPAAAERQAAAVTESSAEEAGPAPEATAPKTEAKPTPQATTPAVEAESAVEAAAEPAADGPALDEPMPGYAELSLASLRARLRGKSLDQVRALLAYEKQTTARDEIVQMFARRIAKLEAGE